MVLEKLREKLRAGISSSIKNYQERRAEQQKTNQMIAADVAKERIKQQTRVAITKERIYADRQIQSYASRGSSSFGGGSIFGPGPVGAGAGYNPITGTRASPVGVVRGRRAQVVSQQTFNPIVGNSSVITPQSSAPIMMGRRTRRRHHKKHRRSRRQQFVQAPQSQPFRII